MGVRVISPGWRLHVVLGIIGSCEGVVVVLVCDADMSGDVP